jgi:endonuclease/exonuclease/phosphatase (EEP) superfamily protein YafD
VLRTLILVVETIFLIGLMVILSVGQDYWPLDLLTFFWTLPIVFAIGLMLIAIFLRGLGVKLLAALAIALACVPVVRMPPVPDLVEGHKLRLISANLFVENTDPRAFVAYLVRTQPDIVVTQETTAVFEAAIRNSGLFAFESSRDLAGRDDKKVFSRFPIRDDAQIAEGAGSPRLERHPMRMILDTPGGPVILYAVHPDSPRSPRRWAQRNRYLQILTQSVAQEPKTVPVVVAGDWNTPPWSGYFRAFFAQTGFRSMQGRPWPVTTRFLMRMQDYVMFGAAIDHIALSPGLTMAQWKVGPKFGSNHLPVEIDIGLPQTAALAQR